MSFAASGSAEPGRQSRSARQMLGAEALPVIDLGRPTFAGDGDTFLGQVRREIGAVVERSDVAVRERQFEAPAVLAIEVA